MTEPQEFSSDFDLWVCSLLDLLRAKGYTNVSVNRGSKVYYFFYCPTTGNLLLHSECQIIPYTQLQNDFLNKQTPQQILDLIK